MKNGKKKLTLVIAVLLSLLFSANAFASSFDEHLAFRRRGGGTCKMLIGQVTMRIVYVNTPDALWTDAQKAEWLKTANEAIGILNDNAKEYDREVTANFIEFQVFFETDEIEDFDGFVLDCLLQNKELKENAILLEDEENVFTVFCFLNERRSLAYADWDSILTESIVANSHDTGMELAHEILHLFGAVDLYFPADFQIAAMTYYPDSIMTATTGSKTVDSLTAYSVGWTNELDETALMFLSDTDHVSQDTLDEAYEEELFTGYAARQSRNITQYGYFQDGILNGYSVCKWDNGDWYAGEFENGVMHGWGAYHWAGGTVYAGDYAEGKRTGQGFIMWPDGTMYVGSFVDGDMTGEGIYSWPDGSCYTGGVLDGAYHGYGTYTDASGQVLEGYWENGGFIK